MTKVLVIAAHPDDEILGAGGTLAKHVRSGAEVHALVLSEGVTSRYQADMASILRTAAEKSAQIIGFDSIQFLGLPDQRLDTLPLIEVTQAVEGIVQGIRPEIVYTHAFVDVNADHSVVAEAAWTACRPYATPWLRLFASFETPSSTEWALPVPDRGFHPQHFVDVSETLETKLRAMECYESELREYPHPRSSRALAERAAVWGSRIGVAAAEPFVVGRSRA